MCVANDKIRACKQKLELGETIWHCKPDSFPILKKDFSDDIGGDINKCAFQYVIITSAFGRSA